MTRPQIVRADTIDLQEKTNPSAQDHSRQPASPSPLSIGPVAPHQAAAVRHVEEERHSEEESLSQWSQANTLREESESGDEATLAGSTNGDVHYQQDQQAIQQNGGMHGEEGDLADGEGDSDLDDDMMDKISSSPSIDDEDIDFEFVYALHTFAATVEGQANATKGDTMVLLDDSNSYWWLVRIVKDSSIGYLPAEHIETPTERLARLNKHRNIDLSATMLGDTAEKSKNPLKKAMRRRNAKTVQWNTQPIFVEASDYEYSSDEDDDDGELFGSSEPRQQEVQDDQQSEHDEDATVEPLRINGAKKDDRDVEIGGRDPSPEKARDGAKSADEEPRTSDEIFDRQTDVKVSRNGTLRNTDSFFKDDNAETRKITLTPALFRDDSSGSTVQSFETRERGASLESLTKDTPPEKVKEDKKKKEKKPGMLSGLFKRKDKKAKKDEHEAEEKHSEELGRGSPSKQSDESSLEIINSNDSKEPVQQPQRQPSKGKLQKAPRGGDVSPRKDQQIAPEPEQTAQERAKSPPTGVSSTMRIVSPEPRQEKPSLQVKTTDPKAEHAAESDQQPQAQAQAASLTPNRGRLGSISNMLGRNNDPQQKFEQTGKVKRVKERVQLDDFDSSPEVEKSPNNPFSDPDEQDEHPADAPKQNSLKPNDLSESPVNISPIEPLSESDPNRPPDLVRDDMSPVSPVAEQGFSPNFDQAGSMSTSRFASSGSTLKPQSPSNDFIPSAALPPPSRPPPMAPALNTKDINSSTSADLAQTKSTSPTTPSATNTNPMSVPREPTWNDSHLLHFMEKSNDVRDLLMLVNDTSGVVPVGPDHEIMRGLFVEERKGLSIMDRELDGLLGSWLARKMSRARGRT